jgi:hypothetical protein
LEPNGGLPSAAWKGFRCLWANEPDLTEGQMTGAGTVKGEQALIGGVFPEFSADKRTSVIVCRDRPTTGDRGEFVISG